MSAIFYHDEAQKKLALETMAEQELAQGKIATEILPFTGFTLAEDYHQKYALRGRRDLAREILAYYPNLVDFVNSTAAARLNGFVGGEGSSELLRKEIDSYGISTSAKERLLGEWSTR